MVRSAPPPIIRIDPDDPGSGQTKRIGGAMYDVVHLDQAHHARVLAAGLMRDSAVNIARSEARRLRVGRMFLAGSEDAPQGEMILIVESGQRRAA